MPKIFISPENNDLLEEVIHGKLMMREKEISLEANIEANGREIFDTDQEIGSMVLLNPISSAIKLGFRSLFAFASSTQVRWSILLFQNSILASFPKFLLTDDEFLPKWNAHTIQVFQAGLTNDFVTSEIDDHAHRMLKHLITKHLQVWTNTNKTANTYRNSRNNQNSITLQLTFAEKME